MSLATYTFSSVVRRGFAPNAEGSAEITVAVAGQLDIARSVAMMTPADVIGIPPSQVIRSWPRSGVHNAEPNYLALVEFDAPDLPWLFSRPGVDGHEHPWLMLLVIDETRIDDPLEVTPLGTKVTVPADQRPDPTGAWLWTHAQLLGTDVVPDDPARSLSRIVCPRRLEPQARYLACVVPTFESGRLAGLGAVIAADDPLRTAGIPGWKPDAGEIELPVYHWFRFSTGPQGDFESLVRRLHGVPLPPGLGRRRLRLDHALSNLPRTGAGDLELHVALRPPGEHTEPIEGLVAPDYLTALRSRLTDADYDISLLGDSPPRVGPPVYGQLPVGAAARAANLGSPAVPPWLDAVNLDPRHRVAAGLGAEVVRRNQEHYMQSAWRQIGDVLEANRLRRRAEYSLGATKRLYDRWLSTLDAGALLTSTSPVHTKVLVAPGETVVGRLRDSPVPPAVVSVELRRFARARGALASATNWQDGVGVQAVAQRSGLADAMLQRVPLDSLDALDPPSQVWGEAASKEILGRLVDDDISGLTADVAAGRLDALSTLDTFTLPTVEEVSAHVAAHPADVNSAMSALGLLPTAALAAVVAQPPPAPPQPRPRPGPGRRPHRMGRDLEHELRVPVVGRRQAVFDQLPAGRLGLAFQGLLALSPAGLNRLDEVVVRRDDGLDLTPVLTRSDVIDTVRVEPDLVTRVGDRVLLDTVRLNESARTGKVATTIGRAAFDQLVAGTFVAPRQPVVDFAVPAAYADGVRSELGEVVAAMAGLVLRPGDSATRPARVLAGGLESLRRPILEALEPELTILRAVNGRISALADGREKVLDDIMAAPDLSEPTYLQLSAISHDWLLPGLDQLPADTTTLVAANREFLMSFLVGMNHELARELLWREYPTDQRGTYARQFWTHLATAKREDQFDLRQPLHLASSSLVNLTRAAGAAGEADDPLVLVVKGELVQRYPGLMVFAARTVLDDGVRVPGESHQPDFVGLLDPDVLLVGFTGLTAQVVRDAERSNNPDDHWWFFFAEHFTEPRFGLDEPDPASPGPASPESWNDAGWQHVLAPAGFLTESSSTLDLKKGIDLGSSSRFRWGSSASVQAWITLQFPFRRGIPAVRLMPPEEAP